MSINESILEDGALDWFYELGYPIGYWLHIVSSEPAAARFVW